MGPENKAGRKISSHVRILRENSSRCTLAIIGTDRYIQRLIKRHNHYVQEKLAASIAFPSRYLGGTSLSNNIDTPDFHEEFLFCSAEAAIALIHKAAGQYPNAATANLCQDLALRGKIIFLTGKS